VIYFSKLALRHQGASPVGESWRIKHSSSCTAFTLALTPSRRFWTTTSSSLTLAHPPHHLRWVNRRCASRDSAFMIVLTCDSLRLYTLFAASSVKRSTNAILQFSGLSISRKVTLVSLARNTSPKPRPLQGSLLSSVRKLITAPLIISRDWNSFVSEAFRANYRVIFRRR
jgi:hypothetical protein